MATVSKRMLWLFLRLLLGIAALAALVYFGSIDPGVLKQTISHPGLLAGAVILLISLVPIAAFRWWLLLRGLGIKVSFGWSLSVTLTSLFCSTFLPGAYGGDIVRVALAYRATKSRISHITFTILVDRISGLVGLAAIGLAMLPLLNIGPDSFSYVVPLVLLILFIVGAVIFSLVLGDWAVSLLSRSKLSFAVRIGEVVRELLEALRAYMGHGQLLLGMFLLSVVMFSAMIWAIVLLGWSMGFDALGIPGYFVAGVWSTLANALPLTPGGLGIGEVAFAHMCRLLEPVKTGAGYATVFLAMRVLFVLISMAGVLPWAGHRHEMSLEAEGTPEK